MDPLEFKRLCQSNDMQFKWEAIGTHNHNTYDNDIIGPRGYGKDEYVEVDKSEICSPDFVIPEKGIKLTFTVCSPKGQEYVESLVFLLYKQIFSPPTVRTRGDIIPHLKTEFEQVIQSNEIKLSKNEDKKNRVRELYKELDQLAHLHLNGPISIKDELCLESTDRFYSWTFQNIYPYDRSIIDKDVDRISKVWLNSHILQEC